MAWYRPINGAMQIGSDNGQSVAASFKLPYNIRAFHIWAFSGSSFLLFSLSFFILAADCSLSFLRRYCSFLSFLVPSLLHSFILDTAAVFLIYYHPSLSLSHHLRYRTSTSYYSSSISNSSSQDAFLHLYRPRLASGSCGRGRHQPLQRPQRWLQVQGWRAHHSQVESY